ncbi:MAG: GNAT family N-acetyltransferase [Pseudomonadota bacterium]
MTLPPPDAYALQWHPGMQRIDKAAWNRLAVPLETPFLEWEWLSLMETSGSISPETGWHPCHLTVHRAGRLVAAAPLYVKTHSSGEFVFDYVWAQAAARMGLRYYPKLVGMVPVTPLAGYRFLMDSGENASALSRLMLSAIDRFCEANALSGSHFLFIAPAVRKLFHDGGYLEWRHQSYRWANAGYRGFEDYLSRFNTNQRRNIRRERRALSAAGISLSVHGGRDLPPGAYARMHAYYARTNDKFGLWGCKYLTPDFFAGLSDAFGRRLVFVSATEAGRMPVDPVAMAMFVRKGLWLYGRYWGGARDIPALHFNACYYTPIAWAIDNGVRFYDPGMGGEHKLRRGFVSVLNFSVHRFRDGRLRRLMAAHIDEINRLETAEIKAQNARLPLVRGGR